jgi:hypothetical protein
VRHDPRATQALAGRALWAVLVLAAGHAAHSSQKPSDCERAMPSVPIQLPREHPIGPLRHRRPRGVARGAVPNTRAACRASRRPHGPGGAAYGTLRVTHGARSIEGVSSHARPLDSRTH